jgi:xanthine/uracil permease
MFEGEKTDVFWIGLIILGLASVALFSILWYATLIVPSYHWVDYWKYWIPPVVAAIVFILIGLYMMKFGVKKEKRKQHPAFDKCKLLCL